MTLRGLARTSSPPDAFIGWSGRITALLADHAERHGGRTHPTSLDPALAVFPRLDEAFAAIWALWDELESTREGHRHGGLLGVGIARGEVVVHPSGVAGPPVARALRLALVAEERGEVLVEHAACAGGIPPGFGVHAAKGDRLGFPYDHVADYR